MKIILEKGKRVNLCLERFGSIIMFEVEDIVPRKGDKEYGIDDFVYARIKKITIEDIDKDLKLLSKIPNCEVQQ